MLWLHPSRVRLDFLFSSFCIICSDFESQENASEAWFLLLRKKSKIEKILETAAILEM